MASFITIILQMCGLVLFAYVIGWMTFRREQLQDITEEVLGSVSGAYKRISLMLVDMLILALGISCWGYVLTEGVNFLNTFFSFYSEESKGVIAVVVLGLSIIAFHFSWSLVKKLRGNLQRKSDILW